MFGNMATKVGRGRGMEPGSDPTLILYISTVTYGCHDSDEGIWSARCFQLTCILMSSAPVVLGNGIREKASPHS